MSLVYTTCARPLVPIETSMKSRRLRLLPGNTQKIPSVHTSPWCIGVGVAWTTAHAGVAANRFRDWAKYTFHSALASPPGCGLPYGSVGSSDAVPRYATSTWPGLPTAMAGKKFVFVADVLAWNGPFHTGLPEASGCDPITYMFQSPVVWPGSWVRSSPKRTYALPWFPTVR